MSSLILATGDIQLDQALMEDSKLSMPVVGRADYLERVVSLTREKGADTVLLYEGIPASRLDGDVRNKLAQVMYKLREMNVRVIFICSEHPSNSSLLATLVGMGIYDLIVSSRVELEWIIRSINYPGTFADVKKYLQRFNFFDLEGDEYDDEIVEQVEFVEEPQEDETENSSTTAKPQSRKYQSILKNNLRIVPKKSSVSDSSTSSKNTRMSTMRSSQPIVKASSPSRKSRPYIIAVLSPASCGATFCATNLAGTMALEKYHTAIIDFGQKRTLHHWFGRDASNQSFFDLIEHEEINDSETTVYGLDAFTSLYSEEDWTRLYGDERWMDIVEQLFYDIVVIDFSSASNWRKNLLVSVLERCDEVLLVSDMDYAKALQAQKMWEAIHSYGMANIRFVMNKWMPEYLPCEESELTPIPVTYYIPFLPDVYKSIICAKPLVALSPSLKKYFLLKDLQRSKGALM